MKDGCFWFEFSYWEISFVVVDNFRNKGLENWILEWYIFFVFFLKFDYKVVNLEIKECES